MRSIIRSDAPPRMGLFWLVATDRSALRLASVLWPIDRDAGCARLQTAPRDHRTAWADVLRLDRTLRSFAFDDFPRGRLDYFAPGRRWLIAIGRELDRPCFISHLAETWGLPRGHLTVEIDRAYSCN